MKKVMMVMGFIMLISLVFALQGVLMHGDVASEEATFHELQDQYWSLDKVTRESAETGSDLSNQLVELQQYPSELMRLKLIGVGKILTGIYILLFGILVALIMMPTRLGMMINKGAKKKK
jgi:hypothetical protein